MSVRVVKWNTDALFNKVEQTLLGAGAVYAEVTTAYMSNPVWNWSWDTVRRTSLLMGGEKTPGLPGVVVPAGVRDIVDTGRLIDSMTPPAVERSSKRASLVIAWKAPYAKLIQQGGLFEQYVNVRGEIVRQRQRPGRDWVAAAFKARPPEQVFADIWRAGAA